MGKQGPCRHCGVTSTPLWRNGPPEKPVLCNACGSRWRTKGSLTNYTPLHAREPLDLEEFRASKPKTIYFKHKEQKTYKKRPSNGIPEIEHEMTYSGQNFRKMFEGDLSNRSSSGSAMSYTESSAHFGATDAYDFTGSAQSNLLDSLVPSKKRTGVPRSKPSPVEKLTKELFSIMHEQPSYLSISSEEDLLYGCSTPMGSFEIGHGGVLIRDPNTKTVEEESEASSLPINNKSYDINKGYSGSLSFPVHSASKGVCLSNNGVGKLKKSAVQVTQDVKRDNVLPGKVDILRDRDSPLSSTDLKDIATFEVFMKHMTNTEQHQLLRYLPCTDTPECLKNMFQSPQFMEALSCFQKLLLDGVFDLSFLGTNNEESRTLKGHVLLSSRKSKWVEHYQMIKDAKHKEIIGGKRIASMPTSLKCSDLPPPKRLCDHQNQHLQELKGVMRSPKRVPKSADTNLPSVKSLQMDSSEAGSSKVIHDSNGYIDEEAACFSPRSIFASPPDQSSMLVSLQFTDESSDQDLLLDLPYNTSFPEAELLRPWNRSTVQSSSPAEGEESLSNILSSHFNSRNQRHR